MPGLYDSSSWVQLPLEASYVNACANGFSLGLSAQLTYLNTCGDTVQAMFVYLLEEGEVVTSFEAVTGNRKVQAHIQNQTRMEECCSSCHWELLPCYCPSGHLVLDTDTAHKVFMLCVGPVHPSAVVCVTMQSSRELQTTPGGAVRVTLNSTLTPLAPNPGDPGLPEDGLCDDSSASCFGGVSGTGASPWLLLADSPPQTLTSTNTKSLSTALTGLATNPQRYHFSFRLEVQGPCLLAGIESPSHALRADASPFAVSASSVWISLAEQYNCDRPLEILLHPSEPHLPHLCLERGIKTFQQYEMHIKERKDFIKGMKKSGDPERQVNFVRRRFHKDLQLNPVLMLNFCPDITALSSLSSDLPTITREVLFIVHLMEEPCHNIQDALLLAVRSLPARTLLNVAGGTSDSRALFPTSRQCSNESLEMACEFFQSNKMFGMSSNFSSVLSRLLAHPVHRGYPRQLFIITDTGFINSSRVLELLRRHARSTRVFAFGLGANAHHKILERAAKLTRGTVELLSEGERLQPKLIKSLKKALEPVLSDITIDWYMPETMEALLTPNDIAPLYSGDSLISYCTLYNTASFRSKKGPTRVARGGSLSSVFQSQEEPQTPGTTDTSYQNPSAGMEDVERALQEISHEISLEFSAWSEDPERTESTGGDGAQVSDIRKRIVRSSYVQEQYMLTHCSVSTEPTRAPTQPSMCSDHTRATSHGSTSSESVGSRETVSGDCVMPLDSRKVCNQGKKSISQNEGICDLNQSSPPSCKAAVTQSTEELVRRKALIHATMSGRSFSSPHGELDMLRLRTVLDKVSQNLDPEDVNAKRSEGLCDSLTGQLPSTAQLDWDMLVDAQYLFSASPAVDVTNTSSGVSNESGWQCQAVIHGYIGNSNHTWETTISLEPLLNGAGEDCETNTENEKSYDLHHLAAHSVIRDNEDMAWRESDIEHGSSRRFRLKAIQTSKSCSQASVFTYHMPVDPDTQDELPGHTIVRRGGRSRRTGSSNSGNWSVADNRHSESMEDTFENAGRSPLPPSSLPGISSENCLEKMGGHEAQTISPNISQKSSDTSLISRVGVGKRKIRSLSGKLSPLKPCLTGDNEPKSEPVVQDYLPLISLQSPEGFFNLNSCFSSVVQISLQRLLRTSPFTCHHGSLSPVSEPCPLEHRDFIRGGAQTCKGGSQPQVPMTNDTTSLPVYAKSCPEALCHQADSGRGSETDPCDTSPCPSEAGNELDTDLEGCSWATAVALAWLEHRCAGFFVEWELLAAKAEGWLRAQTLPDGLQLLVLKGAARQLFLLLRHWDENLNLNMLCYKPGDV
ncbi:von Willebrand factor A domain-containing protein 5B2 isoform 2-T5 [Anomaloglossus baeobatrachus]|uniref:von Willebrand factor A domain-containing protein 5B2 isoform X2 n=1 Tax=Anomaloglossus baeobatrachus TaxID=238106 RepID=UPI003F4F686C